VGEGNGWPLKASCEIYTRGAAGSGGPKQIPGGKRGDGVFSVFVRCRAEAWDG